MPCTCDQCRQHARTLGLAPAASREAIHKAYRDAAKLWHPDRFEAEPDRQPEAEEHFKQVQIAYRELSEHHARAGDSSLADSPTADPFAKSDPFAAPAPFGEPAASTTPPPIAFGNLPGCFTGPHFPPLAQEVIAAHLSPGQTALAIVDLSRTGDFAQFMLFAGHAVLVRDSLKMASMLWYNDLGEIRLIDQRRQGRLGLWHRLLERISATPQKYALHMHRRNGALFYTLASQADDSVKKVIYNFLLRMKYQPQA
jgi:hypothetical protein